MSDENDEAPLRLPDKVAATRSYAPDSLAPFQRLPVPAILHEPERRSHTGLWIGVLLGVVLFIATTGVLLMTLLR